MNKYNKVTRLQSYMVFLTPHKPIVKNNYILKIYNNNNNNIYIYNYVTVTFNIYSIDSIIL